jgi:hypothetical protein
MDKKVKKSSAKKAKAAKTTKKTKTTKTSSIKAKILESLPESIEHLQMVQKAAVLFDQMQERVMDVKEEASKELNKLMKMYEKNYGTLEKKVQKVTIDAKKQAQNTLMQLVEKWHENKEMLPKALSMEVDNILVRMATKSMSKKKKSPLKKNKKL